MTLTQLYQAAFDHMKRARRSRRSPGQRGIQIWVPIEPGPTFEDTRTWVEACPVSSATPSPDS